MMTEDEVFYQVSFVVIGSPIDNPHPGAIMSVDKRPEVGEIVRFGGENFEVLEVQELTPVTGNFGFLHVTCRRAQPA
ncbi:MAG: hypothetical protein KJ069_27155 [Anaerolineae bacterium]|nr:hypothetical protein [Anaerolineae bacterium]